MSSDACPQCGNTIQPGTKTCDRCGTALAVPARGRSPFLVPGIAISIALVAACLISVFAWAMWSVPQAPPEVVEEIVTPAAVAAVEPATATTTSLPATATMTAVPATAMRTASSVPAATTSALVTPSLAAPTLTATVEAWTKTPTRTSSPTPRVPTATRSPAPTRTLPPVGLKVGQRAPDFALHDSSGAATSLGAMRGKPVIINFWASWCGFCRTEMPDLQDLYADNGTTHQLVVFAIDTDDTNRPAADAFVKTGRFTFTVLWDEDDVVGDQYNVRGMPTSYFVDRSGIIRAVKPGAMNRDEMDKNAQLIY
jgi:peroxiredoxin